tara:strand:- start:12262 stop:12555 length:294 start_codon:yes stop_codon:yes gene_type:complete
MKSKILIIISSLIILSSCAGMGTKRTDKADEFLIEKKNPLEMPPDIGDLPEPGENERVEESESDFKETLSTKGIDTKENKTETSTSLKESIIKKIEQ